MAAAPTNLFFLPKNQTNSYLAPFQRYCRFPAPHPYSTLILGVFPLDQIAQFAVSLSRYLELFGRETIFEVFQPMWSRYLNVTDRQTEGQITYCGITALCVASRGKNTEAHTKVTETPPKITLFLVPHKLRLVACLVVLMDGIVQWSVCGPSLTVWSISYPSCCVRLCAPVTYARCADSSLCQSFMSDVTTRLPVRCRSAVPQQTVTELHRVDQVIDQHFTHIEA